MILTDCHMHSYFSSDSETPTEVMVQASIAKKLNTICFTEHMDYDFPKTYKYDFVFDPDAYNEELDRLTSIYSSDITILRGIEIGLKPGTEKKYEKLLNDYPWDFIIGSVHIIDELDPYYPEYWEKYDVSEGFKRYFDSLYHNITLFYELTNDVKIDSLGHLDYILRYAPGQKSHYDYKLYQDIIDETLKFIIDNNIALEINSAGFKSGLDQSNPGPDIIRRYTELGGTLFTIGSDAHVPEYVSGFYDKAENMLKNLGITEYSLYKNRKPIQVKL